MAAFMKYPLWSGSGRLFEIGADRTSSTAPLRLLLIAQRGVFLLACFPSASQNHQMVCLEVGPFKLDGAADGISEVILIDRKLAPIPR
jgi:hypothetical protein